MAVIKTEDLINSVAEALQYISYYHPKDFIDAMYEAYQREESKPAKTRWHRFLSIQECLLWVSVQSVKIQVWCVRL